MPNKKKHHYIPQFYIENFTNKQGRVFVLDNDTGKINEQGRNGTFHLYKFYTVDFIKHPKRTPESTERMRKAMGLEKVDTSKVKDYPDMIEDLLSECESISAPIIQKLIKNEKITELERIELSSFIAFMYTRNPSFHNFVSSMETKMTEEEIKKLLSSKEEVKNIYDEMRNSKNASESKLSLDDIFRIFEEGKIKVEIPKESTIQTMLFAASIIDLILCDKTWIIFDAPSDTSFITNDNPVFMNHPNFYEKGSFSVGFETPGVEVIFPMSKECLLVMVDTPRGAVIGRKKIDKLKVRELNKMIFNRSRKYVIGKDLALVEYLKKFFASKLK